MSEEEMCALSEAEIQSLNEYEAETIRLFQEHDVDRGVDLAVRLLAIASIRLLNNKRSTGLHVCYQILRGKAEYTPMLLQKTIELYEMILTENKVTPVKL